MHPVWTVVVAQAFHNSKFGFVENQALRLCCHIFLSIAIYVFPPYSAVSAGWRLVALLLRRVPQILPLGGTRDPSVPPGPLGKSYAKVCSVMAAWLLWEGARRCHLVHARRHPLDPGPWPPDGGLLFLVAALSAQVNPVLSLWSRRTAAAGRPHGAGLRRWAAVAAPARLTWRHHARLLALALVNAVCEEGESRGFWRSEYALAGLGRRGSNVAQAAFFGLWHYNGIPSGISGVCLTFVYGLLMGLLQDASRGLALPILAHTIADYYIFTNISRRHLQSVSGRQKNKATIR